jgi:hypothetical protein
MSLPVPTPIMCCNSARDFELSRGKSATEPPTAHNRTQHIGPAARWTSMRLAALPGERQSGALAGRRWLRPVQGAHRRLPQPRQGSGADRSLMTPGGRRRGRLRSGELEDRAELEWLVLLRLRSNSPGWTSTQSGKGWPMVAFTFRTGRPATGGARGYPGVMAPFPLTVVVTCGGLPL